MKRWVSNRKDLFDLRECDRAKHESAFSSLLPYYNQVQIQYYFSCEGCLKSLSELVNIGVVLAGRMEKIGVTNHAELAQMGSIEAVL